jgi:hypothetical protein
MTTNTRSQRPAFLLSAFALMLVAAVAGCTADQDPGVATAAPGASTVAAAAPAAGGDDSGRKFSQCMRGQGLTWFPDPGQDGGLRVSVPDGTDQSTVDKAEQACKAYAPGARQNGPLSADDLDKLRQVSQCMRDHGFAKYPDPDANGSINIDERATGISHAAPGFEKAVQECRKYLPPRRSKGDS